MKLICSMALAMLLSATCVLQAADESTKKGAAEKAEETTTVKLRDLSLTMPKSWALSIGMTA